MLDDGCDKEPMRSQDPDQDSLGKQGIGWTVLFSG